MATKRRKFRHRPRLNVRNYCIHCQSALTHTTTDVPRLPFFESGETCLVRGKKKHFTVNGLSQGHTFFVDEAKAKNRSVFDGSPL